MKNSRRHLAPLCLCSLLALEACAPSLPAFKKKALKLPAKFPKSEYSNKNTPSLADVDWQNFFHDSDLNSLVEVALKNNQELSILEQEINIANNEIMARQGEYLPKFSVKADGGVEKIERFSTEDANSPVKFGRLGLATTWEVDIWRKLRNAAKSAYFDYLSSVEGRRYVITNLVAEVANTYFELMALDNQFEIIQSYVKLVAQIKDMVVLQQKAAKVTSLAVKRFEAELFKNLSRKYTVQQEIIITQNRLNLLLGRFPQEIARNSKEFSDTVFSSMQTSVPAKLLDNRPDVKQASLELEAAKLNVEVAKARFYPSLSIEGGAGYEKFNSKHFENGVSPTAAFYGIAANISAPLLNRKAIKADYFSANNKQIGAIYHYEQTLIKAYTEVSNQMTMIKTLNTIYALKEKQVKALTDSIQISNVLFRAARINYIESLFTQRDALEAQMELVELKKQQLTASVNLYKALGGGWKGVDKERENNY